MPFVARVNGLVPNPTLTMAKQDKKKIRKEITLDNKLRKQLIKELQVAYGMEIETVANYLANSIHLDGMLAQEIKESLQSDINDELTHAKRIAHRIKILGGDIPGSLSLDFNQKSLQPPNKTTDLKSVILGVIEAEDGAVEQYQKIIEMLDDENDPVTQDLCIELKGEEEEHRREFVGFLREYESLAENLGLTK